MPIQGEKQKPLQQLTYTKKGPNGACSAAIKRIEENSAGQKKSAPLRSGECFPLGLEGLSRTTALQAFLCTQ